MKLQFINKYKNEEENLMASSRVEYAHEAAFDAYMAGWVFLTTGKYREIGAMMEAIKLEK